VVSEQLGFVIEPVELTDLEELIALRIRAMQPSLEAIGRFDPQRARERFADSFDPSVTRKLMIDNKLAGFYVLCEKVDHLWLDHLYIDPLHQGGGFGGKVIQVLQQVAIKNAQPLRLGALKESRANVFYCAQGFEKIAEHDWDNIYQWSNL